MFPRIADYFGIAHAPAQQLRLTDHMPSQEGDWDQIASLHRLEPTPFHELAAWEFADFIFHSTWDNVSSTIKIRQAGFADCIDSEQIMLGLVEALIERMAEALEKTGRNLERLSRQVFRYQPPGGKGSKSRDFQLIIEEIGARGDLLAMVRESLVSLNRLLAYHNTTGKAAQGPNKDAGAWVKDMLQDIAALSDHATYLTNKTNFLLDATLGLINLEQNQIIKIFSIAAVCLMPPTLVASSYGMNFKNMPELEWLLGYPWALTLMLVTAIIPFAWFKRKGWL